MIFAKCDLLIYDINREQIAVSISQLLRLRSDEGYVSGHDRTNRHDISV